MSQRFLPAMVPRNSGSETVLHIYGGLGGSGGSGRDHGTGGAGGAGQGAHVNFSAENITNHFTATVPSEFRMIPLGDIDLLYEIRVDRVTGIVGRQLERACIRRVYTAKIEGRQSKFTVTMYDGNSAEERLTHTRSHPNIIQVYRAARSGGIYATLYHDELVPLQQFVDGYRNSHFATVYIYACVNVDFRAAHNHIHSTFQWTLDMSNYTAWIRRSSGQLCAELIPPSTPQPDLDYYPTGISRLHRISSASDTEFMVVESLTLADYHYICFFSLSQIRRISILNSTTVNLGATVSWSPGHPFEDPVEIAYMPNVDTNVSVWRTFERAEAVVMEDGWMRFKSDDVFNRTVKLNIWSPITWDPWFSQANHIFRRLRITSNFEDYVLVWHVKFKLKVSSTTEDPPASFLFLCPPEDFRTGPSSFRWPEYPAYGSLDPSGVDRLSLEEATRLGFPPLQFSTRIPGRSWNASVYEGLRKFHRGKGFDPDTPDLARHLGYPLCELSSESDVSFAHVDEGDFEVAEVDRNAEDEHEPYDPQTKISAGKDVDGDSQVSSSLSEKDDPDLNSICGSDHSAEDQEPPAPNASNGAESGPDSPTLQGEMLALSEPLMSLMNARLALILFLGLSWLYEQM